MCKIVVVLYCLVAAEFWKVLVLRTRLLDVALRVGRICFSDLTPWWPLWMLGEIDPSDSLYRATRYLILAAEKAAKGEFSPHIDGRSFTKG